MKCDGGVVGSLGPAADSCLIRRPNHVRSQGTGPKEVDGEKLIQLDGRDGGGSILGAL